MFCSTNLVLFFFNDSRMQIMVVIQMTDIQLVVIVSTLMVVPFLGVLRNIERFPALVQKQSIAN